METFAAMPPHSESRADQRLTAAPSLYPYSAIKNTHIKTSHVINTQKK